MDPAVLMLAGNLASQWAIGLKLGVKIDDIKKVMTDPSYMALMAQGALGTEMMEGILPFSRVTIDLGTARTLGVVNIAGQQVAVESCTGIGVACYLNAISPTLPDPLYLDRVKGFKWPFQRIYLTHTAQAGKSVVLLVGRAGLELNEEDWQTNNATSWITLRKVVAHHGTGEALATDQPVPAGRHLRVKALLTNSKSVYLGYTVASSAAALGWPLLPGDEAPPMLVANANLVFVDSEVDSEGVSFYTET